MYYEERIIEGKWHWRGTPDGSWVLFSEEQLHRKCCALNQEVRQLRKELPKELPKELVETEED